MRLWEIQQAMLEKRVLEGVEYDCSDRLRPKITFRYIQQLRKLRDQRAAERAANLEFLPLMYGVFEEAGGSEKSKAKSSDKQSDQWQKNQSKAALRAIKDRRREHEKNAKEVQSDIKEMRKGQ